jgi:hypothetical protein
MSIFIYCAFQDIVIVPPGATTIGYDVLGETVIEVAVFIFAALPGCPATGFPGIPGFPVDPGFPLENLPPPPPPPPPAPY